MTHTIHIIDSSLCLVSCCEANQRDACGSALLVPNHVRLRANPAAFDALERLEKHFLVYFSVQIPNHYLASCSRTINNTVPLISIVNTVYAIYWYEVSQMRETHYGKTSCVFRTMIVAQPIEPSADVFFAAAHSWLHNESHTLDVGALC